MNSPHPKLITALQCLLGKTITAVTFVEGYVQVEVSGSRISVLTRMELAEDSRRLASDDPDFPRALQACVGHQIIAVEDRGNRELEVRMLNGKSISIDLADPHAGVEALIFEDGSGRTWVA
jgi:hypothetical protein